MRQSESPVIAVNRAKIYDHVVALEIKKKPLKVAIARPSHTLNNCFTMQRHWINIAVRKQRGSYALLHAIAVNGTKLPPINRYRKHLLGKTGYDCNTFRRKNRVSGSTANFSGNLVLITS
jgi:hypothetical protein